VNIGDDDDRGGPARHDALDGLEPAHQRHDDVHRHDVGGKLLDHRLRLDAVSRLADHLDLATFREHGTQHAADQRRVVDDQETNRHGLAQVA